MPARITVKAELQSLLNKSQALTDANRLQQLEAERRRREELAQLGIKRRKAQEEARRRQGLEDPVGRNKRTAAMGTPTVTVTGVWGGRTQEETGLPYPDDFAATIEVRSADFTELLTQSLGNVRPPVISGVFFDYKEIALAFPMPEGDQCIVCYAVVPNLTLSTWDPALSGYEIAANHPLQEHWYLVGTSSVTAIDPLDFPLYDAAFYGTSDPDAPATLTPEAADQYVLRLGAQSFLKSPIGAEGFVSAIFTPLSYGARRLFSGDPYSTVEALAGTSKFNRSIIPKNSRANFTIPEESLTEGYGLTLVWNAGEPDLCASELALMGYSPLPPP
jgi:hypothetical protein